MSIFDEIWACSVNVNRTAQQQFADGDAVISAYIRRGGDINARDRTGSSVLFTATSQGHAGGVKKLIAAGADVDAQTDDGETALCRTIGNGYPQIAKLIIEAGADANLGRTAGKTALMLATERGWDDVVELLRERTESPPSRRPLTQQDKPGVPPQMISIRCSCGKSLRADEKYAGKKAKCSSCGAYLVIPMSAHPRPPEPPLPQNHLRKESTSEPMGRRVPKPAPGSKVYFAACGREYGSTWIDCPHCGAHHSLSDALAGGPHSCQSCGKRFLVPQGERPVIPHGKLEVMLGEGSIKGARKAEPQAAPQNKQQDAEQSPGKRRLEMNWFKRLFGGGSNVSPIRAEGDTESAWRPPTLSNTEEYVRRCMQQEFQEGSETRTVRDDPGFAKVLEPLNAQDFPKAIEMGRRIIPKYPDFDLPYKWLGFALCAVGKFDESRKVYSQGLALSKRKLIILTDMGETEWQSGNIAAAVYAWSQALHSLSAKPMDYNAYLLLSYVAKGLQLEDTAAAFLARVDKLRAGTVRMEPNSAARLTTLSGKNNLGAIREVLKQLQKKYL